MDALNWNPAMTRKPRGNQTPVTPPQDLVPVEEPSMATPGTAKRKATPGGDELIKSVGLKLQEARKAHGWTQAQLARNADCPVSTVFTAENGVHNLSLMTLLRLSVALDIDIRALLPGPDLDRSFVESTLATLKTIEGALENMLRDMGQTTLMLQQLRRLQSDLQKPPHLRGAPD